MKITRHIGFLLLCTLLPGVIAHAQTSFTPVFHFECLTEQQGLSNNGIRSNVVRDKQGYVWIGTVSGVDRYDGYEFKHYQPKPNDPHSLGSVNPFAILCDSKGRLWIGTMNGNLSLYVPESDNFCNLSLVEGDSVSVRGEWVTALYEDRTHTIWVGTSGGLYRIIFLPGADDAPPDSLSKYLQYHRYLAEASAVYCLVETPDGELMVGTSRGLYLLNLARDHFERVMFGPRMARAPNEDITVKALACDRSGILWVGTIDEGLFMINRRIDLVRNFRHNPADRSTISHNNVYSIHEDRRGILWIATENGVDLFDREMGKSISYMSVHNSPRDYLALSICSDSTGTLWMGTFGHGLFRLSPRSFLFSHYTHQNNGKERFDLGPINANDDNTLWVQTYSGAVLMNPYAKTILTSIKAYEGEEQFESGLSHLSSFRDTSGAIWYGTDGLGLYKLDPRKRGISHYSYDRQSPRVQFANGIYGITSAPGGNLWLAALNSGLLNFAPRTGTFTQTNSNITAAWSLFKNSRGKLWIGSSGHGLFVYDPDTDLTEHFRNDVSNRKSISHDFVTKVFEDASGRIWVGTRSGLNLFDRETKSFSHIDSGKTYHNWDVGIIAEDGNGGLWVSYNRRVLSHIDPSTNTFIDYDTSDGLCGSFLNDLIRLRNGKIMITGKDGMNIFHPDSLTYSVPAPPLALTRMSINDQAVVAPRLDLTERRVVLPFNRNVVEHEFAALEFDTPQQVKYLYKLEGLEDEWVEPMGRRFVRYAGLSPGDYIFHLRAIQARDLWPMREASLNITITPPWWRTAWADSAYAFLFLGLLFAAYRVRLRQVQLKQQAEMEHFQAEHLAEVDRLKSRFFANISHEFRTPLTLILGPIEKWMDRLADRQLEQRHPERPPAPMNYTRRAGSRRVTNEPTTGFDFAQPDEGEAHRDLSMMQRNAHRLLRLINQLLDLSKLEAGAMKLRASRMNIVPLVKGIAYSFETSAGMRGIALNVGVDQDEIEVYCDKDMVEKILNNLLSNAFKFTPEGGSVAVSIQRHAERSEASRAVPSTGRDDERSRSMSQAALDTLRLRPARTTSGTALRVTPDGFVEITVSDTGIGIPPEQLDKVFDRFYQIDASQTREHEGSGIGLALVKELVELHHGTIQVQSEVGRGTTFTVRLPLGRSHLKNDEIVDVPVSAEPTLHEVYVTDADKSTEEAKETTEPEKAKGEEPIVLVVEDNADVRAYIKDYLVPTYQVTEARDGVEGIQKALETIPDLIISDVMMPKKDGYEVCKALKLDEKTSHIPIILLTAKAASEDKIEGLEFGADDYLVKPFEPKELLARVKNLIELRRKLRERFKASVPLRPGEVAVTSMDNAFLKKVMAVVEQHIGDEHFRIEKLGAEVGMSRLQLHRKLTALTNQPPGEFIRYVRLHRAMELLQKDAGTVSEIAYAVGFSDSSYFSKCFHKQFGQVPTDVKKKPMHVENPSKTT